MVLSELERIERALCDREKAATGHLDAEATGECPNRMRDTTPRPMSSQAGNPDELSHDDPP